MVELLRLPNFKGCKVAAGTLLPPGAARVTHLAPHAARLEDIPPKTGDMIVAEISCWKIVDDKEKKKRKVEEEVATKAPAVNVQAEAAVDKLVGREGPRGKGNADASYVLEGHGDNEGGLSGLHIRPSPIHPSGLRRDILEEPAPENVVPDAKASYFSRLFGNLPFTPQWGLTNSSRMDNSRECQAMMANLFTPADEEFFNDGVRDESAIRRSWKLLCQSAQQQANILLRFEALKKHHADLAYSAEYKRSLGKVFTLAVGKGFIDGISIGRKEEDIQAILKATPNVDPTSSETFLTAYENLFYQRYPYVDKVARMYLLDPTELQNIMPDETGPTLGEGPRDTLTASYA
nr:hypothetical protein [Tanacetum cinerariifolium]